MLQSLRAHGFTANPEKCAIGLKEAKYLGYVVGRGQIKPQSNKVEAVLTWPKPKSKSQLRTFLGLVGYYRRFVKDFASRAAPLTECLKKKYPDKILWTKAVETAWQDLRHALCEKPVLQAPDYGKQFV